MPDAPPNIEESPIFTDDHRIILEYLRDQATDRTLKSEADAANAAMKEVDALRQRVKALIDSGNVMASHMARCHKTADGEPLVVGEKCFVVLLSHPYDSPALIQVDEAKIVSVSMRTDIPMRGELKVGEKLDVEIHIGGMLHASDFREKQIYARRESADMRCQQWRIEMAAKQDVVEE